MKILGVNISHDTSLSVIEDGEVKNVWEEERVRRTKYWSPGMDVAHDQVKLMTIDTMQLSEIEHVAFASYDKRLLSVNFDGKLIEDRVKQKELIPVLAEKQLSLKRLTEIADLYPDLDMDIGFSNMNTDEIIIDSICQQMNDPKVHFNIGNHHYYHAVCGSHLSPYDEAIVITWDGGGSNTYFDTHPGFQEIECIFHYKDNEVTPKFRRMSNHRFLDDFQGTYFGGFQEGCLHCVEPETETIGECEVEFTSMPSNGMNFSNMSYALGCDKLGRAAGKVMGMASYGKLLPNVHSRHTVANQLEHDALESAIATIQKAVDMMPDVKNIVLSGGFSLNCTNNYKYLDAFPDHQFFVDPIPHDGGTGVGAALQYWRELNDADNEDS